MTKVDPPTVAPSFTIIYPPVKKIWKTHQKYVDHVPKGKFHGFSTSMLQMLFPHHLPFFCNDTTEPMIGNLDGIAVKLQLPNLERIEERHIIHLAKLGLSKEMPLSWKWAKLT